jgi:glycerol-3-phosphate cytidylyltransferase
MIIGFIAGAFDIIHPGYVQMFEEAKNNCDVLCVGLQNDPTIDRPTKLKPILNYFDRFKTLIAIKYIDRIYPYNTELELVDLLKLIKPDVRFLGDDYIGKSITGEDLEIKIHYLNRKHGWSTTKFKKEIYNQIKNAI